MGPLDFLKAYPTGAPLEKELHSKLTVIECFDSYCAALVSRSLSFPFEGQDSSEISAQWIEQNLMTPSLFGDQKPLLLRRGELLSKEVQKVLTRGDQFSKKVIVLCEKQKSPITAIVKKKKEGLLISIDPPPFWSMQTLLMAYEKWMGLSLSHAQRESLFRSIRSESSTYYHALESLQTALSLGQSFDQVIKGMEVRGHWSQFDLADHFSQKNFQLYQKSFEQALPTLSNEELRSFFSFMQGHIVKMLDPTYLGQKKRPSQYDQKIQRFARSWTQDDLLKSLRLFAELEVLAKRKETFQKSEIRRIHLGLIRKEGLKRGQSL